jgi:predicted amidophosphoribosyltransferase
VNPSRADVPPAGALRDVLLDGLAVLLPITCAGCGLDDRALCTACRAQLVPTPAVTALADGTLVASALRYEGVARRVVLAFKEQGRTDVRRALSAPLASAIASALSASSPSAAAPGAAVELAIVPSGRASFRRRGYDPVLLLLRAAGLSRPASVLANLHERASQKVLDRQSRRANLAGSMTAIRPLDGRRFLIVDDVLTTGATLVEAARALRAGGADVLAAATLAATPRRLSGLFRE